jgi:hypothetical protein
MVVYRDALCVQFSSAPDLGSLQLDFGIDSSSKLIPKSVGKKSSLFNSPSPENVSPTGLINSMGPIAKPGAVGTASSASVLGSSRSPKPKRSFLGGIKQTLRGKIYEGSNAKNGRNRDHDSDSDNTDNAVNSQSSELISETGGNCRNNSDESLPVSDSHS